MQYSFKINKDGFAQTQYKQQKVKINKIKNTKSIQIYTNNCKYFFFNIFQKN